MYYNRITLDKRVLLTLLKPKLSTYYKNNSKIFAATNNYFVAFN